MPKDPGNQMMDVQGILPLPAAVLQMPQKRLLVSAAGIERARDDVMSGCAAARECAGF